MQDEAYAASEMRHTCHGCGNPDPAYIIDGLCRECRSSYNEALNLNVEPRPMPPDLLAPGKIPCSFDSLPYIQVGSQYILDDRLSWSANKFSPPT